MRENSRVKEKYELALDGRQVAGLVAGALIVVGATFVLGLNVGQRAAARAAAAARPDAPLPALARPSPAAPAEVKEKEPRLSYHDALTRPTEPAAIPDPRPEPKAATASTGTALNALPPPPPPPPALERKAEAKPPEKAAEPKAAAKAAPKPAEPKAPPKPAAKPSGGDAMSAAVAKAGTLPAAKAGRFAVQVGAAQTEGEAARIQRRHAAEGAHLVVADLPGKGRWYRVQIGGWPTRAEAEKRLAALSAKGVKGFVAENR